jgi:Chromatin-associated proteins containing the HMG domain
MVVVTIKITYSITKKSYSGPAIQYTCNMAQMIPCYDAHGQLVYYVVSQHSPTMITSNSASNYTVPSVNNSSSSAGGTSNVGGYYYSSIGSTNHTTPFVVYRPPAHNAPAPSAVPNNTYQATTGSSSLAAPALVVGGAGGANHLVVNHPHLRLPQEQEHRYYYTNYSPAADVLVQDEKNLACYDDGACRVQQDAGKSTSSRKRNFDDHFSGKKSHNYTNLASRHKHAGDDGSTGADSSRGSTLHDHGPNDFAASKKNKLLAKLEEEKPRRPLTAYNFFFSEERERIIAEMSSKTSEDDTASTTSDSNSSSPPVPSSSPSKSATLIGSSPSPHSVSSPPVVQGEEEEDDDETHGTHDKKGQETRKNSGADYASDAVEEKIRAKTEKILSSRRQCDRPKRSHKKEHGKVSFQVLCSLVGKRWKALSDEQKQYYVDLSKRDIEKYREDMKEYSIKRARVVETCDVDASKEGSTGPHGDAW